MNRISLTYRQMKRRPRRCLPNARSLTFDGRGKDSPARHVHPRHLRRAVAS